MITILALFSYSNANFAVIYLIWFISVIFMLFFIFTLMRFSILAPVDTLNLAFGCSLSKPTLSAGWFVGRSVLICWFSVYGWSSSSPAAAVNLSIPYFLSSLSLSLSFSLSLSLFLFLLCSFFFWLSSVLYSYATSRSSNKKYQFTNKRQSSFDHTRLSEFSTSFSSLMQLQLAFHFTLSLSISICHWILGFPH